jgi:hypothetical protein
MASIYGSTHVCLYVASADYRDALEALVFVGVVDGFYAVNTASLLLGRDLYDLLPADRLASIQRSAALLQVAEDWQTIVFMALSVTMGVALACGAFGFGAGAVITLMIALWEMRLFWLADKRQGALRSHLRADTLPPAEVVVGLAQRKVCEYAVFLHSFGILPVMLPGLDVDPYESRIVEAIRYGACMPVVTLTDPSIADIPIAGACRFAVQKDAEWQEFVVEILQSASLLVVDLTEETAEMSPGLQFEVEIIHDRGLMSRTIFVMEQTGEQESPENNVLNIVEATGAGARVLSNAMFEEGGLWGDFIDVVEDIRQVSMEWERVKPESDSHDDRQFGTHCEEVLRPNADVCTHCSKRVTEAIQGNEQAVFLERMRTEKFQDTAPEVAATCPACGHTWMGSWDTSFKDRQCPQCQERWRVA